MGSPACVCAFPTSFLMRDAVVLLSSAAVATVAWFAWQRLRRSSPTGRTAAIRPPDKTLTAAIEDPQSKVIRRTYSRLVDVSPATTARAGIFFTNPGWDWEACESTKAKSAVEDVRAAANAASSTETLERSMERLTEVATAVLETLSASPCNVYESSHSAPSVCSSDCPPALGDLSPGLADRPLEALFLECPSPDSDTAPCNGGQLHHSATTTLR